MFPIRDHNPSLSTPYVTYALIALNVVVFIGYLPLLGDEARLTAFFDRWALIPARFTAGEGTRPSSPRCSCTAGCCTSPATCCSSGCSATTSRTPSATSASSPSTSPAGSLAALAQVLPAPGSTVPMVGASGAIAGVMGGYLLLFPRARVDVVVILVILVRMIALPAWVMLGFWFALQAFNSYASFGIAGGGVAHLAHAGGFVVGALLALPLWLRRGGPRFWRRTHGVPPHAPTRVGTRACRRSRACRAAGR